MQTARINRRAKWSVAFVACVLFSGCQPETKERDRTLPTQPATQSEDVRIHLKADGTILANGKPESLERLSKLLADAKKRRGQVFYYREGSEGEPHPNAMKIVQLVVENQLPISLSTKPDFSGYVDEHGRPHKRN